MMTDLGYVALVLALVLSIYGVLVSVLGARRGLPEMVASGRNAVYVVGGLVLLAAITLWHALLTDQFQLEYVVTHTERNLPTLYKFSALWGGQAWLSPALDADPVRICRGGHLVLSQPTAEHEALCQRRVAALHRLLRDGGAICGQPL